MADHVAIQQDPALMAVQEGQREAAIQILQGQPSVARVAVQKSVADARRVNVARSPSILDQSSHEQGLAASGEDLGLAAPRAEKQVQSPSSPFPCRFVGTRATPVVGPRRPGSEHAPKETDSLHE